MSVLTADFIRRVGTDIFVGCGAPSDEAAIVASELVDAEPHGF